MTYNVETFLTTELQENCYLLHADGQAVLIDPGGSPEDILAFLRNHALGLKLILNTHGHADHICANMAMEAATGALIGIHRADAHMLGSAVACLASFLGWELEEHEPDFLFEEGDTVGHGLTQFTVLHTPGHSPGSCSFYDAQNGRLFSGDLVFQGSVGRWDTPGGDAGTLVQSLKKKLLPLPDTTTIYPGHGYPTTVGAERSSNPFLLQLLTES